MKRAAKRVLDIVATTLAIVMWALVILLIVASTRFTIVKVISGSMVPALNVGDYVISKSCSVADCQKGDIVAYDHPNGMRIIHRVIDIEIGVSDRGDVIITGLLTQGDANEFDDGVIVRDDNNVEKVVVMPNSRFNKTMSFYSEYRWYIFIILAVLLVIGPNIHKILFPDIADKKAESDDEITESLLNAGAEQENNNAEDTEAKQNLSEQVNELIDKDKEIDPYELYSNGAGMAFRHGGLRIVGEVSEDAVDTCDETLRKSNTDAVKEQVVVSDGSLRDYEGTVEITADGVIDTETNSNKESLYTVKSEIPKEDFDDYMDALNCQSNYLEKAVANSRCANKHAQKSKNVKAFNKLAKSDRSTLILATTVVAAAAVVIFAIVKGGRK